MSFDWKSLVKTVAPTVATALGGPLAGMAVREVSGMVLGKPDGTEDEIAAVLAGGDPDVLLKLKDVEQSFKARMKELDIKEEQLHAEDRASARGREMALKDRTPSLLAGAVFLGFFGILAALIFVTIPEASLSPLNIMLGALGTIVTQVAAYYFGSSKGSSDKNRMFEGFIRK